MKNYYDELEVSKTASKEVIERVYKVLAKKYHPDTTKEIDKIASEEKFKIISEAYEILSDEEKRKQYDIELEQSSPTISYEDYINVVNQRDSLNIALNTLRNEYNHLKNSNTQQYNNYTSNLNNHAYSNNSNYNISNQNFNNFTNSQKSKYYNVETGQPVSAFAYYKYKIKQFFSKLSFIGLFLLVCALIISKLLNIDLFKILNIF